MQASQAANPRVIVATPAYNEEKYIGSVVLKTREYADEVIVLDDGSSDDTAKIARLAGATVICHPENKGYGATIQSIFREARKREPDILVVIDADSQHKPDEIPLLVNALSDDYDIVIGSREAQKGNIPRYRRIGQKILLRATRFLSGEKLADSESGFRAFSKKAVMGLNLEEKGMAISAETIVAASENGFKIGEVPISINYTEDSSTLNPVQHGVG
ncbi:MAG: glycosyltransferase family 2 protein, partial [Dehalococcoidia bacterium]|nr:glycosyltransferase family 2 protein [Dehalococcoidia bacterium]